MNVRLNLLKVRKYVDLMFKSNIKNMKILYPAIEFLSQHGCEKASLILGEYYRSSVLLDMEGCEYSKRRYLIGSEKYRSPNIKKAEFYLTKSRQQGHVIASYYLMDIYIEKCQYEKAYRCGLFVLPHLTKEMRGCCYHALGYMFYNFNKGKDAKKTAIDYWRKAVRCGNGTAAYEMGVVYMYGENVRRDLKLARKYFEKCISFNNYSVAKAKQRLRKLGV